MRRPLVLAILTALLGATLAMATPTSSSARDTASAAAPAVDTSPPAVGTCHKLSKREARGVVDDKPGVNCNRWHNLITVATPRIHRPDWSGGRKMRRKVAEACHAGLLKFFDGRARRLQATAYTTYYFFPTVAQRKAGARWVRCDAALVRPGWLAGIPGKGNPTLKNGVSDQVAKCRRGKFKDYAVTTCNTRHAYRAVRVFQTPRTAYQSWKIRRWRTYRDCTKKLGNKLAFYEWPSRQMWNVGLKNSVCYKRD